MEKFNCLIVEDEPLAAEILQDYISQIPFLKCIHVCRDGIYALQFLQNEKIDVLFLDIHLPKIKGLDFLKSLTAPPQVIITTAYRDYALDGYEYNVVDYLLKPISFNRFVTAVNKIKNIAENNASAITPAAAIPAAPFLLININKKRIKIAEDDILFIESRREYVKIVTSTTSLFTKCTISQMEMQLNNKKFLRIHRSFIVAIDKMSAFTATTIEIGKQAIPIGRKYRETVQAVLEKKLPEHQSNRLL